MIPEFFYKPLYDSSHKFAIAEAGNPRGSKGRKGFREPLLCEGCEKHLDSQYETPISRVWKSVIPARVESGEALLLKGVDYNRFKLLHLSILWRASVAKLEQWSEVSLGPDHEERLRLLILAGKAPPRGVYPVLGNLFLRPGTRETAYEWLMPPVRNRTTRYRIYSIMYGGCCWHTVVAAGPVVDRANPWVLTEFGQMVLTVGSVMDLRKMDIRRQIDFCWAG